MARYPESKVDDKTQEGMCLCNRTYDGSSIIFGRQDQFTLVTVTVLVQCQWLVSYLL